MLIKIFSIKAKILRVCLVSRTGLSKLEQIWMDCNVFIKSQMKIYCPWTKLTKKTEWLCSKKFA